MHYEIIKSNEACKAISAPPKHQQSGFWSRLGSFFDRNYDTNHPLLSTVLLRPGQQICATCYPKYMRPELGNHCPGTGYPGMTSRWRALNTFDCQGSFRMISVPQRACTCRRQPNSFILTWFIDLFHSCFNRTTYASSIQSANPLPNSQTLILWTPLFVHCFRVLSPIFIIPRHLGKERRNFRPFLPATQNVYSDLYITHRIYKLSYRLC